jgi:hypothetical protein
MVEKKPFIIYRRQMFSLREVLIEDEMNGTRLTRCQAKYSQNKRANQLQIGNIA